MRSHLLTKVGVRKIFLATFERYGSVKTKEGVFITTALLKNVKDHGTVCADHVWVKVSPSFHEAGSFEDGDMIMFRARVEMYKKYRPNLQWDIGLSELTKVKKVNKN